METVSVQTVARSEDASLPVIAEMQQIFEEISRRAFGLFQLRGASHGNDLQDWLHAERELVWSPSADIVDTGESFLLKVAIPGCDAEEIEVTALTDYIVIRARTSHRHEETEDKVRCCEFSEKSLFRRLSLPGKIDVKRVSATLHKGILRVVAPKTIDRRTVALESSSGS